MIDNVAAVTIQQWGDAPLRPFVYSANLNTHNLPEPSDGPSITAHIRLRSQIILDWKGQETTLPVGYSAHDVKTVN
jgi:hypothetical protein